MGVVARDAMKKGWTSRIIFINYFFLTVDPLTVASPFTSKALYTPCRSSSSPSCSCSCGHM